jgi:DNA-binding transcriptional LysR family regulator
MIKTKLIGYAVALARHGNFAKAADSLGLSQPSLSRNIATLESQVGVALFDRGPKGVVPNAFGQVLLQRGKLLIETEESLLREIQLLGKLETGRLVVGTGPYAAEISIGVAAARLLAVHPRLRVRVITDGPEQIREGLLSRRIDVGVFDEGPPRRDDPLQFERLPEHRVRLFCRPGHPLTCETHLSVKAILAYPLVTTMLRGDKAMLVMAAGVSGGRAITAGTGRNTGDFEPAIHVNSLSMASQIATQSDAIYPGPAVAVNADVEAGRLVELDFSVPAMHTRYALSYLRDQSLSPAASAFIELLRTVENEKKAADIAREGRAARRSSMSGIPATRRAGTT